MTPDIALPTILVVSIRLSDAIVLPSHLDILSLFINHSSKYLPTESRTDLPNPASIDWWKFIMLGGRKQRNTFLLPKILFTSSSKCVLRFSQNIITHTYSPWTENLCSTKRLANISWKHYQPKTSSSQKPWPYHTTNPFLYNWFF